MRRRIAPSPEPPAIDRARVHELILQLVAARDRGEVMHQHPALNELGDLCGIMAYYRFGLDEPRTPEELREFEEAILTHAPIRQTHGGAT